MTTSHETLQYLHELYSYNHMYAAIFKLAQIILKNIGDPSVSRERWDVMTRKTKTRKTKTRKPKTWKTQTPPFFGGNHQISASFTFKW